ncbi:MAG: hypothetical protein VX911_08245 [Candidatus Latescibacterota bacterium]|nr:hypothetical protein [Candidatus Latescibacterota bacterium]
MSENTERTPGNLTSFLQSLRQENNELSKDREVKFAVCSDTNEVAVTRYHQDVKMVLIGPRPGG